MRLRYILASVVVGVLFFTGCELNENQKDKDIYPETVVENDEEITQLPKANAGEDQEIVGTEVTFDGSGTTNQSNVESYLWYKGTSIIAQTQTATIDLSTSAVNFVYGTNEITLFVIDKNGLTSKDTMILTINGGTSGELVNTTPSLVVMVLNTQYSITSNTVVTKTSTDANVIVDTSLSDGSTTITLTSGSATCTECTEK
jgi:hypothetical protein